MFFACLILGAILVVLANMYQDAKNYHRRATLHMDRMEIARDELLGRHLPHIVTALDKAANLDVIPEIEQEN